MAEAAEPTAPEHLGVPLEVVYSPGLLDAVANAGPGNQASVGMGGGSSKVTPHLARAPTTLGAPSKDASHIRDTDNTRSPVMLEAQSLMARTMTMPLEEGMKCKKCSSSNIARSSSCETNQKLVPQSH